MMIPAIGMMTVSDRFLILLKIPAFHALGVWLTSPAIVPTFVFTSVNIPSRLDITQPCSISFMSSVIFSTIVFIYRDLLLMRRGL